MTTESRALLQDYIIDVEAAKPKVSGYDVVLQNNSDFIIRRKTAKLEQDLVVLVSKDLYYLKNVRPALWSLCLKATCAPSCATCRMV